MDLLEINKIRKLDNSSCVTDGLTLPTISLLHNGDDKP